MAVKRGKQGSRLSAFGHHTFSFQWPLMQGGIDFPLQYISQKTGNCVQHQTFGEFDTMMVSNTGAIGKLRQGSNRRMVRALPSGSFFPRQLVAFVAAQLHGTLSTPGIWVAN